jgi:hypothetical protein
VKTTACVSHEPLRLAASIFSAAEENDEEKKKETASENKDKGKNSYAGRN